MDRAEVVKKIKPFAPILSAVLVISCVGVSLQGYEAPVFAAEDSIADESMKEEINAAVGSFDLEDGVYQGTGTGYAGDIVVSVQIKDKQIVSIDILSSSDDEAFFNRAKSVIDRIIERQELDVDTVSGATYSSKGIISAVKNALTGEKDSGETGASQAGNAVAGSSATVDVIEDAKAYKDGVYYGTGTGFGGTLKVKVEISGGKIASIQVVEHKDGGSYIQKASALISNIIASQSTNVDTVSGATYSSVGIIQAVRSALSQAAVSTAPEKEQTDKNEQGGSDKDSYVAGTVPYVEGIYYGTAEGYNGDITVAVVIQDHTIKAILVTEEEDDETFFTRAMEVVKNVIKLQKTEVDTVSGATYSSAGLLNAVKNALKEAERVTNGEAVVDTALLEAAIAEAETLAAEDYTDASWAAVQVRLEDAEAAMGSSSQEVIDKAAENLNAAISMLEKRNDAEEGEQTLYIDGTYSGSAVCMADEDEDFEDYILSLKLTVRNDRIVSITDVKGDGAADNDSYIKRAANGTSSTAGIVTQIINAGSTDGIDAVSRATCSSEAIIRACQDALERARR
ncbi:MAG: FMN-binding protein [Eubacteriales bacterium]|nr:FMN-binding protein [Eubacteriales bacterium]